MSTNKSNKPELRFKGFYDDWEQRKLSDITNVYDGVHQTPDYQESGIMFLSVENIATLKSNKYISQEAFERDYKNYPEKGDILMTRIGDVGTPNVVETTEKVAFYVSLALLKPKNIDSYFLCNAICSPEFQRNLKNRTLVTAIPQKINKDEIGKVEFLMPQNTAEQKAIGAYFKNLDRLITLHQYKLYMGVYRKGTILTYFWEQRKFSDITYPSGEKNRDNLPYESYSITNESGFVPQDEKFENGGTMRDADKRMYYIVSPQSFAYNPARINVGSIGYQNTSKNVIVSSLYEIFKTTEEVDDRFLWHWFRSDDFQKLIVQLQEGGVRLYFYYDKLCMGSIALPSLAEQQWIGAYLDKLDNLITLHQRKIIYILKEVFIWIILIKRVVLKKPLSLSYRIMVGRKKLLSILQNRI